MAKKHRALSVLNRQAEINSDFTKVNPQRTEAPACPKAGMIYAGHPVSFVYLLYSMPDCVWSKQACSIHKTDNRQMNMGALGQNSHPCPSANAQPNDAKMEV